MSERIKVKFDCHGSLFEFEGPSNLFKPTIESITESKLPSILLDTASNVVAKPPITNHVSENKNKNIQPAGGKTVTREKSTKTKASKVTAEKFDIYGDEKAIPKLVDFFNSKNPGSANAEKIVVIAYYITELLGEESFSDGQIEYAFKMLKILRPNHLRQIITNAKNNDDWFDKFGDTQDWVLTRGGELYVSDTLPKKEEV